MAVGREMKGETVRGIWASRGWASEERSVSQSVVHAGDLGKGEGKHDTYCCRAS